MIKLIKKICRITNNHYSAALEHKANHNIDHVPTKFQAFRMTIYDLLCNKTVYLEEYNSHLVYEIVKVPTLGLRTANVIRMYVPLYYRGTGITSVMLDMIPEDTVISGEGKHGEVGRLYVSRTNI